MVSQGEFDQHWIQGMMQNAVGDDFIVKTEVEMTKTSWRAMIESEMKSHGDSMENMVGSTLTNEQLDDVFYEGHSYAECRYFTLWTKDRVYFPVHYDGDEYAGSVPRNPCDEETEHFGGG